MGFFDSLRRFAGEPSAVAGLGKADSVARLLPPEAVYASTGVIAVLGNAEEFNGGPPGDGRYGRDLGFLPTGQEPALLARTADSLFVVGESGEIWRQRLTELTALDAHRSGGFLIFMRDGSGLAVSIQTPVQIPPGWPLRTVGRVTNQFAGWEKELDVPHHW